MKPIELEITLPEQLQTHVSAWLAANSKEPHEVRYGALPLGMVQRWIERAQQSEKQRNDLRAMVDSARQALRSYQFGNSSSELAEEIADAADKLLAEVPA